MDSTVSISKGVFVFKNGATSAKTNKKPKKKSTHQLSSSLLDTTTTSAPWYQAYASHWNQLNTKIEDLQKQSYDKIYKDLVTFIEDSALMDHDTIPTAALLTGINQSDHIAQFSKLCTKLQSELNSLIIVLESRNCPTPKATIETLITSFTEDFDESGNIKLKRHQLNLWCFKKWYEAKYGHLNERPKLIVMMPDFEGFPSEVLQNLILVLHGYGESLPFVFVFGIATSFGAIHESLPFNVTNKITVKVFQADASPVILNKVIDQVLLTPDCPFHLSGTTFRMLTDIFLFYDFSVHEFVQGFKFCMMEHFNQGNIYALCSNDLDPETIIKNLTSDDFEDIRHLHSFRKFIEMKKDPAEIIKLLTDDTYLRKCLPELIDNIRRYWQNFHCALEVLFELCTDLPKAPFGKHLRELYRTCISIDVSEGPEFKEILQLLTFMSKEEIIQKLRSIIQIVIKYTSGKFSAHTVDLKETLDGCVSDLSKASMETPHMKDDITPATAPLTVSNRFELKAKLLQAAKQPKAISPYNQILSDTIDELKHFISTHLRPLTKAPPLIELFVFMDHLTVKRHIMGVPRAAIHQALNNPAHYLQCECCEIDDETKLLPTMPDVSIVYKLHLECGKMINMFDWLQSFKIVVDERSIDDEEEDDGLVDPKIQARFTRAVAELQFLGFIKPTKRKTDHVQRLTW